MKTIVMLSDGMADEPVFDFGGKTPLEYASTPTLDRLAKVSEIGMVRTIPEGMAPGSDVANLSVIGYNPRLYYTGRSPLEALSIGAEMDENDVALRCNLVTVSEEDSLPYEERRMVDHSASEITTEEAEQLLSDLKREFESDNCHFYTGTSYRHCMIWRGGEILPFTPPHDILEQKIGRYLPENDLFLCMLKRSYEILKNHPVNQKRRAAGLNPANSFWFWGAGTKPSLPSFWGRYHKKGVMISAVDLLKGIAVGIGLDNRNVEGATGGLNTNYEGKAQAAADALLGENYDFAYIHLEAPDEMGHQGSAVKKAEAIHRMDTRILAPLLRQLDTSGEEYRLLVLPDHPTPVGLRTHTANPVPYLLYDSTRHQNHDWNYNEQEAVDSKNRVEHGWELMDYLFSDGSSL